MAATLTGRMTVTCTTDADYTRCLADVTAAGYANVSADPIARTISFDVNQAV